MRLKGIISTLLFICVLSVFSQEDSIKKEVFKVWGNCEMCKKKIDSAAKSVDGVKSASWSITSDKIKVKYDTKVASLDDIKKAIAKSGYDTEEYRAEDEVYNNLHHCCQYERPKNR